MTDTIPYEITGRAGEIEFRRYPDLVLAAVDNIGDYAGFKILLDYIKGANTASNTISMTSPVITSRKIAMTAPVVSDKQSMSFVMPPGKNHEEIPEPVDKRIRITTLAGREVAVIRFRGYTRQKEVAAAEDRLWEGLMNAGIEPVGGPFLMRYNPPWIPGFMRRNEVGMEIKRELSRG